MSDSAGHVGEESEVFYVVVNDQEQHSLLPAFAYPPPAGWRVVFGAAGNRQCLDYVEVNWTDLRPRGLREARSLRPRSGWTPPSS